MAGRSRAAHSNTRVLSAATEVRRIEIPVLLRRDWWIARKLVPTSRNILLRDQTGNGMVSVPNAHVVHGCSFGDRHQVHAEYQGQKRTHPGCPPFVRHLVRKASYANGQAIAIALFGDAHVWCGRAPRIAGGYFPDNVRNWGALPSVSLEKWRTGCLSHETDPRTSAGTFHSGDRWLCHGRRGAAGQLEPLFDSGDRDLGQYPVLDLQRNGRAAGRIRPALQDCRRAREPDHTVGA